MDTWDDHWNETLDNVNLWKKVLEFKDENSTLTEEDLRREYLAATFQADEVEQKKRHFQFDNSCKYNTDKHFCV